MFWWKDFLRDHAEAIKTLAQARADRFRIQSQLGRDFGVTQVAIITQLDDFPARILQLIEALPNETRSFGVDQDGIRSGTLRSRIDFILFMRAIEREVNHAATAFLGPTFSAKIQRLVRGYAQQPRLKRTPSLKRCQISHHREEGLLADLFRVFVIEVGGQLENEARRDRIIFVEQRIPGVGVTPPAASNQVSIDLSRIRDSNLRFAHSRSALPI